MGDCQCSAKAGKGKFNRSRGRVFVIYADSMHGQCRLGYGVLLLHVVAAMAEKRA